MKRTPTHTHEERQRLTGTLLTRQQRKNKVQGPGSLLYYINYFYVFIQLTLKRSLQIGLVHFLVLLVFLLFHGVLVLLCSSTVIKVCLYIFLHVYSTFEVRKTVSKDRSR